jgi:hypothetical protein
MVILLSLWFKAVARLMRVDCELLPDLIAESRTLLAVESASDGSSSGDRRHQELDRTPTRKGARTY